jgi:predicted phage terminase large subunit-like protein
MAEREAAEGEEQSPPPDYTAERDRCTESFRAFVIAAWRHVEPRPMVWGWHMDAMVDHLEAVTRGDIKHLIINVPPGSSKTLMVQVFWPAWEWICNQHPRSDSAPDGHRPDMKYIFATYSDVLARDKSKLCRKLLDSVWYRTLFGDRWQRTEQWGSSKFENAQGGWRLATSVGGQATGQHADRKVVDDPVKPQSVLAGATVGSKLVLENAWTWWTQTMGLRDTGPETAEVVIMQRLHESDLVGRLLKDGRQWTSLIIPQQFELNHPHAVATVLKRDAQGKPVRIWHDPRTEDGELMCPARFPLAACEERKLKLRDQGYAAQEQQRPSPAGGGIYKRAWFKHWTVRPHGGVWALSVDCTFKDTDGSDYVALEVWAALGPDFHLVDQVRDHLDVLATCSAIRTLRAKWTAITAILIEDKANGPAVITIMQKAVPGIIAVNPEGGKIARANATASYHASGNVYLPDPVRAPWVHDYIEEHTSFPFGAHDDQVDAQSQAITYLAGQVTQYDRILAGMKAMGVA